MAGTSRPDESHVDLRTRTAAKAAPQGRNLCHMPLLGQAHRLSPFSMGVSVSFLAPLKKKKKRDIFFLDTVVFDT